MSCCQEYVIKYILFIANFLFAIGGLVLLGLGIAVQVSVSDVVSIAGMNISVAPVGSIVIGSIIFIISFFGCCGAIRLNSCMLFSFSGVMLLLMITKIIIGTIIFVGKDELVGDIPTWLEDGFNNNRDDFHEIEKTFLCCGPSGPIAYGQNATLPTSCCETPPCNFDNAFAGCNGILQEFFEYFWVVIGVFIFIVAAFELVSVIFGFCLASHARNRRVTV